MNKKKSHLHFFSENGSYYSTIKVEALIVDTLNTMVILLILTNYTMFIKISNCALNTTIYAYVCLGSHELEHI
jgi:hypothetical protein